MKRSLLLRMTVMATVICLLSLALTPGAIATSSFEVTTYPLFSSTAVVNNPNHADRLNLRASPSTSAASLGKYYNGVVVEVLQDNAYGTQWWQVRIGQTVGYMQSKFLLRGGEGTTPYVPPQAIVTGSASVNLRSRADIGSQVVTRLNPGLVISVLGNAGNWYHVRAGNSVGYINVSYAEILSSGTGSGSNGSPGTGGSTGSGNSGSLASLPSFPSNRKVGHPSISGLSMPVYSAPSRYSIQGANGKATVGMDSTFYIYGKSDWNLTDRTNYSLIAYTLTSGGNRIGWVDNDAILAEDPIMPDLEPRWGNVPAVTTRKVNVTDDPMAKQATLLTLSSGAHVTALARLVNNGTTWIYIDGVASAGIFRGFVTADALK
ncbi:hypothetical protein AGMMS49992_03990 [Clostridia bacterium]|nr:hypothetical protein AGMMS49992_03990 [Clostridia bacterium]